ncbi:MAG: TRADD-N-associated membrane domain-containing protein [Terracidiphilus sp.]
MLGLIAVAAVVAAVTFGLIEWRRSWDNPAFTSSTIAGGQFTYKGNPVSVNVTCECPRYLIESRTESIHLTFYLKSSPPAGKTPVLSEQSHSAAPASGAAAESSVEDLNASPTTSEVDVWAVVDNVSYWRWWGTYPPDNAMTVAPDRRLSAGVKFEIDAIVAANAGNPMVELKFGEWDAAAKQYGPRFDPDEVEWRPEVRPLFLTAVAPYAVAAIVFLLVSAAIFTVDYRFRQLRRRTAARLAQAQKEAHSAWETARIKLEAYLDRNLIQVNLVFWMAVFVMFAGFSFVLVGIYILFKNPGDFSWVKALPAISGLITQFIGATFMVIYRSTMSQANDFMSVLERINTVGMAVHELDRIPEEEKELKNEVRARLVESLVGNSNFGSSTSKKPTDT